MEQREEALKREVDVWGLSANIINAVVGAGIFVLPAIIAASLGASSIVAYLFCGFLIVTIMLCFAEIGGAVPQSGGAYSYIELAFGKYPGFLTTNLFVFGSCVTADGAVANALVDTLSYVTPVFQNSIVRSAFFIVLFSGLAYLNIRGVKEGITMVKITTLGKLTPLLLLIFIGWKEIIPEHLVWTSMPSFKQLGEASLILFFAFQGAETALNIGGEIKSPSRTIPRAILISISIILLLYIVIQVTAQGVLGAELPDFKEAPLAEVSKRVFGTTGILLIVIGASISMFGNISGEILNLPRIMFRASLDEVIPPKALSRVHPKYATPYISIICYAALGCILAIAGEFKPLAMVSSASMLLIYLGVALSVIKFRRTGHTTASSFRIPGGYVVPVLAIAVCIWLLSHLTSTELISVMVFLLVLTIIYFALKLIKQDIASRQQR